MSAFAVFLHVHRHRKSEVIMRQIDAITSMTTKVHCRVIYSERKWPFELQFCVILIAKCNSFDWNGDLIANTVRINWWQPIDNPKCQCSSCNYWQNASALAFSAFFYTVFRCNIRVTRSMRKSRISHQILVQKLWFTLGCYNKKDTKNRSISASGKAKLARVSVKSKVSEARNQVYSRLQWNSPIALLLTGIALTA